jgi:hypothetical protein
MKTLLALRCGLMRKQSPLSDCQGSETPYNQIYGTRTVGQASACRVLRGPKLNPDRLKPVLQRCKLQLFVVVQWFLLGDFHRHANSSRLQIFEDRLPVFQRDRARRKNSSQIARKMFDE